MHQNTFYDDYLSSIINNKGDSISLFKNLPTYFWSLDLNRIYKIDYKFSIFIYKDGTNIHKSKNQAEISPKS